MGHDIDESVRDYRAKIAQLQNDLYFCKRPKDQKRIEKEIELLKTMVRQTFGRAGKLLNKSKLVNAVGTIVGCIVSAKGGFCVYRRTKRFISAFDFVNLGRLFSADEIETLATRLAKDEHPTYLGSEDWARIAHGLGKRERVIKVEGKRTPGNRGLLAKDLLEQIGADFNPHHFTLMEVKAEYASVSSTELGTPVYYDECFQFLEEAGLIAKNEDGSYRICDYEKESASEDGRH
jgi:hypothetical protein